MPNAITRSLGRVRSALTIRRPTPQLGPGGPPAGLAERPVRGTKMARETHPLVGSNFNDIARTLIQAFAGDPSRLMDLYDDVRDRDARVDTVARTRVMALQGRAWSCTPPEGFERDVEAQRIAERCTTIIRGIQAGDTVHTQSGGGWSKCVGQMADGILRNFSVQEIEWGVTREGWHAPKRLWWYHPNRFRFDDSLRLALNDFGVAYRDHVLSEHYPRDKWLVHSATGGRATYPTRRGVLLSVLFPSLTKRFGLRWWVKGTERWGVPMPVVNFEGGIRPTDEQIDDAHNFVRQMMANWNGVAWGGVKLESIGGGGSVNPAIFSELVRGFANTEIAIAVLGQNLTTEVGENGARSAVEAQNLVRRDLQTADLQELDATITHQLLEPIVRYNWPGAPVPVYRTEDEAQEPIELDDVAGGIFTPDEYRSSKGYGPQPDGTGAELVTPDPTGIVPDMNLDPDAPGEGAPGGDPFGSSRTTRTSPTSAPTLDARRRALYRRLAASAPSPSRASLPSPPSPTDGGSDSPPS